MKQTNNNKHVNKQEVLVRDVSREAFWIVACVRVVISQTEKTNKPEVICLPQVEGEGANWAQQSDLLARDNCSPKTLWSLWRSRQQPLPGQGLNISAAFLNFLPRQFTPCCQALVQHPHRSFPMVATVSPLLGPVGPDPLDSRLLSLPAPHTCAFIIKVRDAYLGIDRGHFSAQNRFFTSRI